MITTPFDVVKTHRQMELGELVFSMYTTSLTVNVIIKINKHHITLIIIITIYIVIIIIIIVLFLNYSKTSKISNKSLLYC